MCLYICDIIAFFDAYFLINAFHFDKHSDENGNL